jgi:hypothetical protein
VPGYGTAFAANSLLQLGMGLHFGALLDLLDKQARRILANPYQCEKLDRLNEVAMNMRRLRGLIPSALGTFSGITILARDLRLNPPATDASPATLTPRVLAALRSDNPPALLKIIGMFLGGPARDFTMKPDGKPVPIPILADAYKDLRIIEPLLMMTTRGIAMAAGPNMVEATRTVLDSKPSPTAPAFLLRVNAGEPARELLADIGQIIDEADANATARGLTPDDIAGARKALKTLRGIVPDGPLSLAIAAEVNPAGLLISWRSRGDYPFDADIVQALEDDKNFEALARVIGVK